MRGQVQQLSRGSPAIIPSTKRRNGNLGSTLHSWAATQPAGHPVPPANSRDLRCDPRPPSDRHRPRQPRSASRLPRSNSDGHAQYVTKCRCLTSQAKGRRHTSSVREGDGDACDVTLTCIALPSQGGTGWG
jgi:hypothetical protein